MEKCQLKTKIVEFFLYPSQYSFNFTVVYLCQIVGGIPPPSGVIVGKNRFWAGIPLGQVVVNDSNSSGPLLMLAGGTQLHSNF